MSTGAQAQPITDTYRVSQVVRGRDGLPRFLPTGVDVAAVADIERAANFQTLQALRRYSLGTLAGLFVASLAIGWWLSGRALRPVRRIASAAAEISATDLSRRIDLRGPPDELRYLADTLDDMLARLEEAFAAQRRLVDDASHELRNPLAIIQTNVDAVLSRDDVSTEDRQAATAVVARTTGRMSRLLEDLLATARRAAPAPVEVDIDLAGVAGEATEEFRLLAAARSLSVTSALAAPAVVTGDRDALRRAVANLLSNAVRLAPAGSTITVATGRTGGAWCWVAVRDEGPGIAPDDQNRVFDRFWRDSPAHSALGHHAGLGLAIVRQIAESHGGRVDLHSRLGVGSTFVLWLPAASRSPYAGNLRPPPGNPLSAASA